VVGSHFFIAWLYRETRSRAGIKELQVARWKWRWTIGLAAMVVLTFVAGIATVGVTHQLGWLLTSKEPWVVSESGAIRRAISTNNLRQIGLALHWYHQYHGSLPPGGTFDRQGHPLQSWQAMILPNIAEELHSRIDFSKPWNDARNAAVFQTEIPVYLHPAILARANSAGYGLSHYAANVYMLGGDRPRTFKDVPDGTANTLMAGEVTAGFKAWGDPTNWRDPGLGLNQNPGGFGSPSPGGVNFLMVDGSVRFLKNTIDHRVLKALSTPAGDESVGDVQY
jgi:prepilin-type processing-associated H-X9-DG protein